MSINQLECFRATIAHQPHEGFLFYANFTKYLDQQIRQKYGLSSEQDLQQFYGMFQPQEIKLTPPANQVAPDFSIYYKDLTIPEKSYINSLGILKIPGSSYHFTKFVSPLRNANRFDELESFPYPNVDGYFDDGMADAVKLCHDQGRVAVSWVGHMYEDSWQIRGYEEFLMDMIEQPEWCEFILDKITERNLKVACAAARAGVDYIRTGDDVANQRAMMFRPEQWRHFMKSRWARVYEAARRIKPDIQIWYHSDGNIADIIPELIEIGVTILNPVQPECLDPVMVKKLYGQKIVIDGSIGTQTTMPFGDVAEVRQVIKERVTTLGYDGALILSPTHILEPEVPLENIQAFADTVKEFGKIS